MYTCDINRMEEKITKFSSFGDTGNGGITRFSLSAEAICARNEIKARMTKLGLDFKTDDIGNIYCTLPGTDSDAGVIMSGSHCDSVKQGGNYDGILGVLTAMEVIETIVVNKYELFGIVFVFSSKYFNIIDAVPVMSPTVIVLSLSTSAFFIALPSRFLSPTR